MSKQMGAHTGELTFTGQGVAAGVVVGPAVVFLPDENSTPPERRLTPPEIPGEQHALRGAVARARAELDALTIAVARSAGQQEAGIFQAQSLMLADPDLSGRAEARIATEAVDAITAMQRTSAEQAAMLHALSDPLLQARAADVLDVAARVVRLLGAGGDLRAMIARSPAPPIIIATTLTPSETAQLDPDAVAGLCLALGGTTSHAAILAKALGLPAIVGVGDGILQAIAPGDLVALDVAANQAIVRPSPDHLVALRTRAEERRQERDRARTLARQWRSVTGATRDGWRVLVAANIASVGDALAAARDWGAEAIGLLRTEFLFGGRPDLPDEDEQAEIYARIFASFTDSARPAAPIVARTLDAGADKPLPALRDIVSKEENPALGYRGLRIHLDHPDLLRAQVRAMIRAAGATHTPLQIMFPMVATVEEARAARAIVREEQQRLRDAGRAVPDPLPIGIMVETPAAVFMAEALAREVDFMSIGTNDLTQYVMASDRLNAQVAPLADPLQPAVLQAIRRVARAGQIAGRPVAVCGEMAGMPALGALLVGLGITELSMSAPLIPAMKEALASASYVALRSWTDTLLALPTLEETRALLAQGIPVG
jgi:phosphoenolpyruvate-protein phosphotransferase